jgi:hypothetical protein
VKPVSLIRALFTRPKDGKRQHRPAQCHALPDRAHLFLLSRFLTCSSPDQFRDDYWRNVLGKPATHAIHQFIKGGLIEEASVAEKLASSHNTTQLKNMLTSAGLTISGSKAAMAQRFANQRPDEARARVANIAIFRCTERGRELGESVITSYRKEREEAEHAASQALPAEISTVPPTRWYGSKLHECFHAGSASDGTQLRATA